MDLLRKLFTPPEYSSDSDQTAAYLLNFITVSFLIIVIPVSAAAMILTAVRVFPTTPSAIFIRVLPLLLPVFIPQILLRRRQLRLAGISFIFLLWLVFAFNIARNGGMQQITYGNFVILILSAGMILGVRVGLATMLMSILYGALLSILIGQGVVPRIDTVQEPVGVWISGSALFLLTGILMSLFVRQLGQTVASQRTSNIELLDIRQNLEILIGQRTRDLELAAEVSQTISADMSDVEGMLQAAVDLIRSRFGLYYVQIYLLDERGVGLEMRAGTGDVGRILRERRHRLNVGPGSINGAVASSSETIIVPDTETSLFHRANSLLPATRSEMAVPLMIQDEVLGVLDIQSDTAGALSDENQYAFEVLAGQLAISIQHTRLLSDIQQEQHDLELRSRDKSRTNWAGFFDGVQVAEHLGYAYAGNELHSIQVHPDVGAGRGVVELPVELTGHLVGSIQLDLGDHRELTLEEKGFVDAIGRQVAQKVDNIRLAIEADAQRESANFAQRRLTNEGWRDLIRNGAAELGLAYEYDQVEVRPADEGQYSSPEARVLPIQANNAVLGELVMDGLTEWEPATAEMIEEITARLGQHVENLRLSEQSAKRAAELETVAQVSTATSTILDTDQLLQAVVDLTKSSFELYHAHVYLMSADDRYLYLAAGSGSIGTSMVAEGRRLMMTPDNETTG